MREQADGAASLFLGGGSPANEGGPSQVPPRTVVRTSRGGFAVSRGGSSRPEDPLVVWRVWSEFLGRRF